jgi:hypothetical protein
MKSAARQVTEPAPANEAPTVIHLGPPPDVAAPAKARHGSEKRQRSAGVLVKVTPTDHQRLKADAAAAGMSVAGYLASGRLGDETASRPRARQRRRLPKIEAELLARNNAELNWLGNNQNQTTRALHELRIIAREIGADRLEYLIIDAIERSEAIAADLTRTLAANRRACGYDSEG